ncbi:MAG: transglutaminase-like domain-containing protein [Verrucomicrobiales bacterium]
MVRSLTCFGGLALVAATAILAGLQLSERIDVLGLFGPVEPVDEAYQRGFRSDAMVRINRVRDSFDVELVRGDEELQAYLRSFVGSHPDPGDLELEEIFSMLQTEFPGAQYLAANLVVSPDREELLRQLGAWSAAANPEFDSITTSVFRQNRRLGALGVVSRRLPEFSLAQANQKGGRFYNTCPHCDEVHALELGGGSSTLILSCPYCDRPFDVLAADTSGRIRRATEFFDHVALAEPTGPENRAAPEERIVGLWGLVADRCDYEIDQDHSEVREVWKSSRETWEEKAGDCEDTSILLADVLISAGFDARVAIGWNGNIGQHAWVVVRVGETQYVLESTLQNEIDSDSLAKVDEASAFYQPEQLFDRGRLYYTTARPEKFGVDYFSDDLWKPVPSAPKARGLTLR